MYSSSILPAQPHLTGQMPLLRVTQFHVLCKCQACETGPLGSSSWYSVGLDPGTMLLLFPSSNSARPPWYPFKGNTPASAAILFARGQVAVACIGSIATCLCSQKKYHGRGSPCVLSSMNTALCLPPFFSMLSRPTFPLL